jgi:acyl carrier protein
MGLDSVELVMAIEEAFEIQIEDSEAEQLSTPRDVIELVSVKTSQSSAKECLTQRAFHRLRSGIVRHCEVRREAVKPKTQIASLISRDDRRRIIRQILDELGIPIYPRFVRPGWLVGLICFGSLAIGISAGLLFLEKRDPIASPIVIAPFIAVVIAWVALQLTKRMRYELEASVATVGGLSRWVVARGPGFIAIEPGKWTREQIAARIREIVIDQLGCEMSYREEARFVQDLGMD